MGPIRLETTTARGWICLRPEDGPHEDESGGLKGTASTARVAGARSRTSMACAIQDDGRLASRDRWQPPGSTRDEPIWDTVDGAQRLPVRYPACELLL